MPAVSIREIGLHEEPQAGFTLDQNWIEQPGSLAETPIDFLDSDDVSAYFPNYIDNAIGPDIPVGAPAFVDIIGSTFTMTSIGDSLKTGHEHAALQRVEALR